MSSQFASDATEQVSRQIEALSTANALRAAVIVVNWNRREDTLACLQSLREMTCRAYDIGTPKLILVDNGSADGTVEAVRTQFPAVDVISLDRNLGFAGGCNVGLRKALNLGSDYVLLVNNDAIVASDMLDKLIAVAETNSDAGLVGPVIYRFDQPNRVWSAGYRQRLVTLSAQPPTRRPEGDEPYEVDRLYGAGLLIRRQLLEDVGLFDERFFMYYEDADLCRRAQKAGYRLLIGPKARMWHKVSASTGEDSAALKYHLARSSVLFFAKHTPFSLWPVIIIYRFGVAIKKLVLAARDQRQDVASAYLRGLIDGLRALRSSRHDSIR